jgi:malate synthase
MTAALSGADHGQHGMITIADFDRGSAIDTLGEDAIAFLARLHRRFEARRRELLEVRRQRHQSIRAGAALEFAPETAQIRAQAWTVAPAPPDLQDRRCEITGPPDAKMLLNALGSGARVYMADLEDASSPTWDNLVQGQVNLTDAICRRLEHVDPSGKRYALQERGAVLVVRPRGWHLVERHLLVDGEPVSGSLFDAGLYVYRNVRTLLEHGSGPYLYLPKLEGANEAALWNDVFVFMQEELGLPVGTIRATVLIETLPAAFEMDEILWELREHITGLNAGRWDYMFSTIKTFRTRPSEFLLPDRNTVTMTVPFLRAYTELLVKTCHRRGAHAIGGMAAFIPSRRDPAVNEIALARVREDKQRESRDGFDGSWVAHPDLVPVCTEVFDEVLGEAPHQLHVRRDDVQISPAQLLDVAATPGAPTQQGLQSAIRVALRYLAAWLDGTGAVAIDNLMEDAATAEIARSQVWQWLAAGVCTPEEVRSELEAQVSALAGTPGRWTEACEILEAAMLRPEFEEFLTIPAYELLCSSRPRTWQNRVL